MKIFDKANRKYLIGGAIVCLVVYTVGVQSYFNYRVPKTEPYKMAMMFLKSNNRLIEEVGAPLEMKMKTIGGQNIEYSIDSTATAYFNINVHGSVKDGTAIVRLNKDSGGWKITEATLFVKDDEALPLYPDN